MFSYMPCIHPYLDSKSNPLYRQGIHFNLPENYPMDSNPFRLPTPEEFMQAIRAQAKAQDIALGNRVKALQAEWLEHELAFRSEDDSARIRMSVLPLIEKTVELHDLESEIKRAIKLKHERQMRQLGVRAAIRGPYKPRLATHIIGQRFGRLTVIAPFKFDIDVHEIQLAQHHNKYRCKCECGNIAYVHKHKLTQAVNGIKSCGCARTEASARNQQRREREQKKAEVKPKSSISDAFRELVTQPAQARPPLERDVHAIKTVVKAANLFGVSVDPILSDNGAECDERDIRHERVRETNLSPSEGESDV
jgi:hypothetical protein